ncbi:MAG: hypothetical protein QXR18_06790 [Pyrobaculum sp.]
MGSWRADVPNEYSPEDFARARAIAITGNYNADSNYATLLVDIDNIDTAETKLNEAVGEDWRVALCSTPWSFCGLTGPRCPYDGAKNVRCEGEVCRHGDHEFPLSQAKRGMYVVVRVPRKCIGNAFSTRRSGDIELIYNNYQNVWGVHPSGLRYTPVKWHEGKWIAGDFGPGEIISCDVFARLAQIVSKKENPVEEEEVGDLPQTDRPIEGSVDDIVSGLKKMWGLVSPGGGHYHDFLIFSIASLARRAGIAKEEVFKIFEPIFAWAVENGLDDPREIERHHRRVINWIYSGERKIWGKRRFEELIRTIARGHGLGDHFAETFIATVYEAFNLSAGRPTCVPIAYRRSTTTEKIKWICNTPKGVVEVTKSEGVDKELYEECMKSKPEGVSAGEWRKKCKEEASREMYKDKVLLNVYFTSAIKYRDVVLGIEYISATWNVVGTQVKESISMARMSDFVGKMSSHRVYDSPRWNVIFDRYKVVEDIIVSGFVCPPPQYGLPCKVRDYFNTGVDRDPDPAKAREAFDELYAVLDQFKPSEHWLDVFVYAYAQSMFASFSLTRKLWNVRPELVALVGRRHTGKTTVAKLVKHSLFHNAPDMLLINSASSVLRAARVGRLQSHIVTTWLAIDEVDAIAKAQEEAVLSVLKSYATSPEAWRTATGEVYPAYAGITMTANKLEFGDPDLADKVLAIEMNEQTDREKEVEFSSALLKITPKLINFGAYYLKYAEKNWESVKDIILGYPQRKMAVDYMNMILESLGLAPIVRDIGADSGVVVPPRELFRRWLNSLVKDYQSLCSKLSPNGIPDARQCLSELIDKGVVTHIKTYHVDGQVKYRVLKSMEHAIGVNIVALCHDLGGEIYTRSTRPDYYKSCIVAPEVVEELLEGV